MSGEKASSKEPAMADTSAEEPSGKKKKPPILILAAALAACGAGGAGVYFLAPPSLFAPKDAEEEHVEAAGAHGEKPDAHGGEAAHKKDKTAKKKDAHGGEGAGEDGQSDAPRRFAIIGDRGVYTPGEIVVSIRPSGRVKHLKLSIAIETSVDSEQIFAEREPRIRDALNTYLRAVDVAALEDPAGMGRIRAQIARRVEFVVAPAPVHAILITDFILN